MWCGLGVFTMMNNIQCHQQKLQGSSSTKNVTQKHLVILNLLKKNLGRMCTHFPAQIVIPYVSILVRPLGFK